MSVRRLRESGESVSGSARNTLFAVTRPLVGVLDGADSCLFMKRPMWTILKRSDQVKGFVVLPKRWIVERTIAWLNRVPDVQDPQGPAVASLEVRQPFEKWREIGV